MTYFETGEHLFNTAVYEVARKRLLRTARRAGILPIHLLEGAMKSAGISVEFPGYSHLQIEGLEKRKLISMFFDLRDSTLLSEELGAEASYVAVATVIPTLAEIILNQGGFIVDYPGDGIMALWGFNEDMDDENVLFSVLSKTLSVAHLMHLAMNTINDIFDEVELKFKTGTSIKKIWWLGFAIGISHGSVIITRVGPPNSEFQQAKAIGPSINRAAKLSSTGNQALNVDKPTWDIIPTSNGWNLPKFGFGKEDVGLSSYPLKSVNVSEAEFAQIAKALRSNY